MKKIILWLTVAAFLSIGSIANAAFDKFYVTTEFETIERDMTLESISSVVHIEGVSARDHYNTDGVIPNSEYWITTYEDWDGYTNVMEKRAGILFQNMVKEQLNNIVLGADRVFVNLGASVFEDIDIFVKIGQTSLNIEGDGFHPDDVVEFNSNSDFIYGGGIKAKLFEIGNFKLFIDAQYLKSEINNIDMDVRDENVSHAFNTFNCPDMLLDSTVKTEEYHAAITVSKAFGIFVPYTGVRYSEFKVDLEIKGTPDPNDTDHSNSDVHKYEFEAEFEAKENISAVVGTDIYLVENLFINLEGRFIAEETYSFGLTYNF